MDYSVAVAGLLPGSTYVKTLERDIGFITLDLCCLSVLYTISV